MRIDVSETPRIQTGRYLSELLEAHHASPILLMLSGGSVSSILPHINTDTLGPHVTITFVDERFTLDSKGSNFLQFQQTDFYETVKENSVSFISTVPKPEETQALYTDRISLALRTFMSTYPNAYTLGVFGIGDDGHTASIFPSTQHEFTTRFDTDEYYVAVTNAPQPYVLRSTIPPFFIEECIDDVVLYAVGENKCNTVLIDMHNKNLQPHEVPALIPALHPESILFTDCHLLIS